MFFAAGLAGWMSTNPGSAPPSECVMPAPGIAIGLYAVRVAGGCLTVMYIVQYTTSVHTTVTGRTTADHYYGASRPFAPKIDGRPSVVTHSPVRLPDLLGHFVRL